jgi:hypothetical protein
MIRCLFLGFAFATLAGCSASGTTSSANSTNPEKKVADKKSAANDSSETDEVRENLAKLSPEDRALAEAQGKCVIAGEPLGSMGVPVKLTVKGQPVFICCAGCKKAVEKDPDAALAKVEKLKKK